MNQPRPTYTREQKDRAMDLYGAIGSGLRVAGALGCCRQTVYNWIRSTGTPLWSEVRKSKPPLTLWERIMAPGPGEWDMERLIAISEARNSAIAANPSGFPRPAVQS